MSSRALNITLPEDLIKKIDQAAKSEYTSRSDFIRDSIVRKLKKLELDEWGDVAGLYKESVDLRDSAGHGISAIEFRKIMKTNFAKK